MRSSRHDQEYRDQWEKDTFFFLFFLVLLLLAKEVENFREIVDFVIRRLKRGPKVNLFKSSGASLAS